jgi:Bacterial SH3 domain
MPMKRCPQCSAEYDDRVRFCTKDGKLLVTRSSIRTRLCPHCANSVAEDALKCPYCKADLSSTPAPEWPTREEVNSELRQKLKTNKISLASKAILIAGLLVFALGVFLIGGQRQRNESQSVLEERLREVSDRDKKIQDLEGQLAQARKELAEKTTQVVQLKTKLDESQKNLVSTQQKLTRTTRETERLAASRAASTTKTSPRVAEPSPPAGRAGGARGTAEMSVYQTIRPTSVYEEPATSSRVVSQITKGTRVNVVRSLGDWLEVRSKGNNPPGFVRRDDVTFVSKAN